MRRRAGVLEDTTRIRHVRPRIDADHLGFRLLDSANVNHQHQHQYYMGGIPEPPRAPEPYKIAAASSTMSRAHRRSSFVILAGNNETTTVKSVGGSPMHERTRSPLSPSRTIMGRSSPFRPRGFKGPPPHAQSRPQSPPPAIIQRRFIQPKSRSQGSSPRKQSLIPQPRASSIAVRANYQKPNDRDRWARRSGKRITRIPRSSSLKAPTKRPTAPESTRVGKVPIKSTTITNSKAIAVEKKVNRSPTKIPIRHTSNGRFIQMSSVEKNELKENNLTTESPTARAIPLTDESIVIGALPTEKKSREDDPGLVDLLKQSSSGSGTSSVVNATTTTAVQPLRIDAAKILSQDTEKSAVKSEEKIVLNNVTEPATVKNDKTEIKEKLPSPKMEKSTEPINKVSKPAGEPMNVEAVIETIRDDDRKEVKEMKDDKALQDRKPAREEPKEDKDKAKPITVEPDERPKANLNVTTTTTKPVIEKHESQQLATPAADTNPQMKSVDKVRNHGSETSLKSSNGVSTTGSVESIRSNDTGVSLNTVRGVSSAREKRGTHVVKRSQEIETLSGNVMNHESQQQQNGEPAIVEVTESTTNVNNMTVNQSSKVNSFVRWKNSMVKRLGDRWSASAGRRKIRLPNCRRGKKQTKQQTVEQQQQQQQQKQSDGRQAQESTTCSRLKAALRCRSLRWSSKIAPAESTSCCRPEKGCCFPCNNSRSWCRLPMCCRRREPERNRSIRAKHSLTSVAPPPLSEEQKPKIPEVLIEHNSVMRGAIPCLPVPLAWFCLIWNVLLPGTGTLWSGLFNLCIGQPRFAATASAKSRFGALIVDIIVGVSQLFTVLFCLVGWGWSIWWGVTMVRLARKWKRFKAAEASNSDPETGGTEGSVLPTPGIPTQALRGMERAR